MKTITQDRVKYLFEYNPDTGQLIWKNRPRSDFKTEQIFKSFHSRCAGRIAGSIESEGYRIIGCDNHYWKAQILIWLFVKGELARYPTSEIDHVNGVRSDNRIKNLRMGNKSKNQRNSSRRVDNKSGVTGVNWVKSKKRWVARIWDGPHHRCLVYFKNLGDAAAARRGAEIEIGYHEGHGKIPQAVEGNIQ